MRTFLVLLLLLQLQGPVLTSQNDGFSITLPDGATVPAPRQFQDPHTGRVQFTKYRVDMGPRMYVVTCLAAPHDAKQFVAALQARLDKGQQGEPIGKADANPFKGCPAFAFARKAETAGHVIYDRLLYVIAGSHLYTIEFVTPDPADLDKAETKAFFDSFTPQM
ncbi:MAG: hypothetical protein ACYCW6_03565 [Candidatus Xenobia bacterium]